MAGGATQSAEQVVNVTLRVLVDKARKKVVYAEAEKDFVDVLLSFLTLPLGTIARLVSKESNIEAVKFNSISSLYQSVSDLKEEYLWNKACKEMLIKPGNSMEAYCHQLKLNIDETEPLQYLCEYPFCRLVRNSWSIFYKQKCKCGMLFNSGPVVIDDMTCVPDGFVKETASFIIRDDLYVMPNHLRTSVCLLKKHGINDLANTEKKTLLITKKEVVDLLKLSLLSKTPITDFILKNKNFLCNSNPKFQSKIRIGKDLPSDSDEAKKNMVVILMVRKSNTKVLFATAEEDFADFLFSFLAFPLGVLQMLEGLSSLSSIDGLYRSMTELSSERY
ncbi:hypothetical protein MtrunA17_Chr7g0241271 [Medicago truncatula]|uniref:DUF674 family protein n=1 Tax=Medicago truncatula TaxID=3880 RepID=A0A396H5W5_MEDTR|nr:hypothetical protein MtrunA17_Chr7g0241271 [Medicago truncatula]